MLDVLKTLSSLVKNKPQVAKRQPKVPQKPFEKSEQPKVVVQQSPAVQPVQVQSQVPSIDVQAEIKIAQAKAKEMIIEAKDEAIRIRQVAEDDARRKLEQVDRRDGALEEKEKRLRQA